MCTLRCTASIEVTKYGTYRVRWRKDGKPYARSFATKGEAQGFAGTMARAPRARGDGRITLEAMAEEWLESAHNLSAGSLSTYRRDLDRYIIPELGSMAVDKIKPATIDRYLTAMGKRLDPSSVHRHYRTLRRMFSIAHQRGRLDANPCDLVEPPRVPHREMRFLTVEEVDALADKISPRYRAWVYVAAYLGLRWSEAVGLQRKRVNGAQVLVADQLVRRDGVWCREEPKTKAGRRTITAPAFVADILQGHLEQWSKRTPDGLVFVNQYGNPVALGFQASVFKPALKRAGIDTATRIHDMRHTSVALAIAVGAHPKAIQARMGHASISVTLDRYGHLFADIDSDIATALDKLHRGS